MRLPPRGVCRLCRLCLGGFLVDSTKTLCFARFSSTTRRFGVFVFQCFSFLFFGSVFAKVSQIPCFSCFLVPFLGQLRSFCLECCKISRFLHSRRVESQATSILKWPPKRLRHQQHQNHKWIRMDVITPPSPPLHRTTTWQKKVNKTKRKHKSQSHGRHHPPPPPSPPELPHRVERQTQVEAGLCRKSRDGNKNCKNRCEMRHTHTHRKTQKKTMRNGQLSMFLDSAPLCGIFR